jgi:hypothetical protein
VFNFQRKEAEELGDPMGLAALQTEFAGAESQQIAAARESLTYAESYSRNVAGC